MKDLVALMDTKSSDWIAVERMLHECDYRLYPARSLQHLEGLIRRTNCRVALLDLDMVSVHNRFFRSLKKDSPHLSILALSERTFHPELREALAHHICTCFRKPIEVEELAFWLKAIASLEPHARAPTDTS